MLLDSDPNKSPSTGGAAAAAAGGDGAGTAASVVAAASPVAASPALLANEPNKSTSPDTGGDATIAGDASFVLLDSDPNEFPSITASVASWGAAFSSADVDVVDFVILLAKDPNTSPSAAGSGAGASFVAVPNISVPPLLAVPDENAAYISLFTAGAGVGFPVGGAGAVWSTGSLLLLDAKSPKSSVAAASAEGGAAAKLPKASVSDISANPGGL